ncbi:hypothetical protein, partial [uncultured Helicobacter sp.]|uniref:hypothetical protein n=1 Tax=uncultured Helicobacter sp. TaxID=175537 RepID=UPI00263AACCE
SPTLTTKYASRVDFAKLLCGAALGFMEVITSLDCFIYFSLQTLLIITLSFQNCSCVTRLIKANQIL